MPSFQVIQFDRLDSTNTYARERLCELAHGDVIQAHRQMFGRGRWDRRWVSDQVGNLCLSIVIKPPFSAAPLTSVPPLGLPQSESLPCLSHLLAVCLCRVLNSYGVLSQIKWPNDILVADRKLAGILAESVAQGRDFLGLVLGIGVNLNMPPDVLSSIDRPATSLNLLLGHEVEIPVFRDALLEQFFASCSQFLAGGFRTVRDEYLSRAMFIGKKVEIRAMHGNHGGTALDINDEGALVLSEQNGAQSVLSIGEMHCFPDVPTTAGHSSSA